MRQLVHPSPSGMPPVVKKSDDKQITFRLSGDLHARLNATADGMELDISSLLRLMIRKHLPEFEREAKKIREQELRSAGIDPEE
jgi:predicted transcriptional regulator